MRPFLRLKPLPRSRSLPRVLWLSLALLAGLHAPARADVWGFVDDKGVAHFASEKLDDRYELFFRSADAGAGAGSASGSAAGGAAGASASADGIPPPPPNRRLVAYFDVSPSFKAVRHLLRDAADTHGLEFELLQALIATESGFDPRAVSPKGAVGLMQIMPATAERFGVRGDARHPVERQLTDPALNIRTGARYLRELMRLFPGRLDLVLAAYNAGEGAVLRAGRRIPDYPETQNYVRTVMQIHAALKPPAQLADRMRQTERTRLSFNGAGGAAAVMGAAGGVAVGGAAGRGNMVPPLSGGGLPGLQLSRAAAGPSP